MKKRVMGILLTLCLSLTLLPSAAFAAYTPPVKVDEVTVSVTAPMLEVGLKVPTVADNAPYFIDNPYSLDDIDMNIFYWDRVAAKGSKSHVGSIYDADGTNLVSNSWYRLRVKLLLDYGYVYSESVKGNVPGAELVEVERYKDDAIYLSAWFKVGSPTESPKSVSTISVSDVQTTWDGAQIKGWSDKIQQATIGGDGYRIYDAALQKWNSEESCWNYCYDSDPTESGTVYGVILHLNTLPGYAFEKTVTATVNGSAAEIVDRSMDEVEIFVPFGNVTIDKVEVKSSTWPIDGNAIRKDADNFTLYNILNEGRIPYTLKSARFQIKKNGSWRDLTDADTTFNGEEEYRVIAELEAKDYASFTDSVTGDFNGRSGTECQTSNGGKACTVTRTCAVYEPVYTYNTDDPNTHINSVTIHQNNPQPGEKYADGVYAPSGGSTTALVGVNRGDFWYEVPCVGSTEGIKKLTNTDTFEAGKVYWYSLTLRNADNYRFGDGFTVSFAQMDGSESNYAMKRCETDTEKRKVYDLWYTVGDVTQTPITQVAVTGPAYQNGTVDISDPSAFRADVPVTLRSLTYNNYLSFTLLPQSGHYFGRTVTVTYNGKEARVSDGFFSSFDIKYIGVSYSSEPATPVTVTGIAVQDKAYDGTTAATLTGGTFSGVAEGDTVALDFSDAKAEFDSKDTGNDKRCLLYTSDAADEL